MQYCKEEKEMWIEDWRRSGKGVWAYAKANGLNPQTFSKWTKAGAEAKPCFVEIPAQVMQSPFQAPEILIERGDVKIHIPLAISSGGLRSVMEGLGAAL